MSRNKHQSAKAESRPPKPVPTDRSKSLHNPNSGDQLHQKGRVVEQLARPRRLISTNLINKSQEKTGANIDELTEKLNCSEALVKDLRTQMLDLKAELDGARSLNMELESINRKLNEDLTAAQAKLAALASRHQVHPQPQRESNGECQSLKFKDIQKLIANKLEHNSNITREAMASKGTTTVKLPLPEPPRPRLTSKHAGAEPQPCLPAVSSLPPPLPPPPPPPPPRPLAKAAISAKALGLGLQECYHPSSLTQQEGKTSPPPPAAWNHNKPTAGSAHSSIVGEIQNRSAHLLAIKSDVETKGEFINCLIHQVMVAAYTDIDDVLKFVDSLDSQLSSLADERAVLKHFKWPEKKVDAMREAAIEYRDLKLLEMEISSYEDDSSIPSVAALKRIAGLQDKSERSIERLIKLRNSVMHSYLECKIPIDWMLDSGIICKIKQASMRLATIYMKRVAKELQLVRNLDKESTQEALLLQGMHFAHRAHQFAGALDSETLRAFEEIRECTPGQLIGSQELLAGIALS
ncbi:hypothetical protein CCACVL1_28678 [Corchorus capsularis]|uniref:Protein CHUP1, chloroplastic n=1 Tax=Corchorus capsularis TaxID=210143 RepID=A0A1R3G5M8_COCAP|nr:hypothetical protein CCACVL1_28678 [Corchorus capsularis]